MHGRRDPSFLDIKKNPPSGDEDGLIMPAFKESGIYFSMASCSFTERLKSRPKHVAELRVIGRWRNHKDGEEGQKELNLF